ncbi:MAG: sulfatase family protein [Inquilinaceae bacterium]
MAHGLKTNGTRRPNIVLLLPDQLRWDFVGCYGARFAATPHIDALAARGVRYDRALSPSPICIPARASLLTGHNALSTGVLTNNYWLRPDHDACGVPTWARLLSDAGYHTEAIGKMHFIPWDLDEGFGHRVIAEDKRHVHIEDDYAAYLAAHGLRKLRGPEEPGYTEHRMASVSPVPPEHQVDVWTGDRSVDFLETYKGDRPFALMVGFPGPHDPYNPPEDIARLFRDATVPPSIHGTAATETFRAGLIRSHLDGSAAVDLTAFPEDAKRRIRRHYTALMKVIDDQVGRIVAAVERRGQADDTVILFASDHGDFLGDFDLIGKGIFYEPSIHVPLIAVMPGMNGGTVNGDLVSLTDLFATITAAAGLTDAPCQDSGPLPGLGLGGEARRMLLGATGAGVMMADRRFKLARYRNGLGTLFDVERDPAEQTNLIDDPDHAETRERLDSALASALVGAVVDGNRDKAYPYVTMTPDHPAHRRGWRRPYPADGWRQTIPAGL